MSRIWSTQRWLLAAAFVATVWMCSAAQAQPYAMYLSEVYFNTPGGDDDEYIEVGGGPTSAAESDANNNYYIVNLECDDGATSNPGVVDFVEPLNDSFNACGYAWYTRNNHGYSDSPTGTYTVNLEAEGGTWLILRVPTSGGTAPAVGDVWDTDNNGTFDTDYDTDNEVIDAIGLVAESADIAPGNPRCYAPVNFYAGSTADVAAPTGAVEINTNDGGSTTGCDGQNFAEIEYVGRWGNCNTMKCGTETNDVSGCTINASEWVVANLTNNAATGYSTSNDNYGVSGDHNQLDEPECWRGSDDTKAPFSYGKDITVSRGWKNVCDRTQTGNDIGSTSNCSPCDCTCSDDEACDCDP